MSDLINEDSIPVTAVNFKPRQPSEPLDCLDMIHKVLVSHYSDASNLINRSLSNLCTSGAMEIKRIVGDPSAVDESNTSSAIYVMGIGVPTDSTPANLGTIDGSQEVNVNSKFMIFTEPVMITFLSKTAIAASALAKETFLLLSTIEDYLRTVYNLYGLTVQIGNMSEYMPTKGSNVISISVTVSYPYLARFKTVDIIL